MPYLELLKEKFSSELAGVSIPIQNFGTVNYAENVVISSKLGNSLFSGFGRHLLAFTVNGSRNLTGRNLSGQKDSDLSKEDALH